MPPATSMKPFAGEKGLYAARPLNRAGFRRSNLQDDDLDNCPQRDKSCCLSSASSTCHVRTGRLAVPLEKHIQGLGQDFLNVPVLLNRYQAKGLRNLWLEMP